MGISKTISGYLDGCACDSQADWEGGEWNCVLDYPYSGVYLCIDTADKHEGIAAFRWWVRSSWTGGGPVYFPLGHTVRTYDFGPVGGGAQFRVWSKKTGTGTPLLLSDRLGTATGYLGGEELMSQNANQDWTLMKHTIVTGGFFAIYRSATLANNSEFNEHAWIDRIVICLDHLITVTGLTSGQKVELYRSSDNAKLDTQTCAGGENHVHFDVDAEDFPEQMYMKIYGTNGTMLLETSPSYNMCGGDTWEWTADAGTMTLTRGDFIIYRGANAATPKSTAITANLKTPAGANYPGALIYFQAANGTVSPSSDTTDAGGDAHTTLASLTSAYGIAVVKAQWLGDANVPACSAYIVVHIFYDAESPDSSVGFQLYVEGYPLAFVSGKYGINGQGKPESFEVEIPEWDANIVPFGLVSIYRKGVKEFAGVYLTPDRHLSDAPRVALGGLDQTFLLVDRVVDLKIYSGKIPAYIVNDLLTAFDSGISPGSLESSADALTITITSETLLAAIQRVCDAVCWDFRVNLNRTLDLAENFGGLPSGTSFTEGVDIFDVDAASDYGKIANWIRMVGDGIISTKQDGTNIMDQGMHQLPSFQTSISSQSTLDIACQALLDLVKDRSETELLLAYDGYAPGIFKPEDTITVTAPSVGMAGEYQIKRIERDMTDANFVLLELSNRLAQYWELDEAYRRMVKDLSV